MLLVAEGYIVVAEMLAKVIGYKKERVSDTKAWLTKFRNRWMMANKESELSMIEETFDFYEKM